MNGKIPLFSVVFIISAASNGWLGHRMLGAAAILGSAFILSLGGIDADRSRYYPVPLVIGVLSITTLRLLTSDIWIDNLVLIIAVSLVILEHDISIISSDLLVIGRQVETDFGGRINLFVKTINEKASSLLANNKK